jgi:predicted ArsR family transcriptional regulator
MEDNAAAVAAVAALDEPTRRRLYDYVVRQPEPVSRDQAADAHELPRTTAAFHLDRLVDQGLLDVLRERRTGRTGPGAGRPAKLYRRATCEVSVSLPARHYDLAAQLLAQALQDADSSGRSPRELLEERAYEFGTGLATAVAITETDQPSRATALRVLEAHGYEPITDQDGIALANCPFHILAQRHTELVCGMNLHLLIGLLDGLTGTGLTARLNPTPRHCCVRLESDTPGAHCT